VTDFLDEKRDEIDLRLAELKPVIEEYNRLLAAAAALRGVDGTSVAGAVLSVPDAVPNAVPNAASVISQDEEEEAQDGEEEPLVTPASAGAPAPAPAPVRRGPGRPRISAPLSAVATSSEGAHVSSNEDEPAQDEEASASRPSGPRRAGRPKGSGTRAAEALRIVREHPGVTIPELADRMGIKQNYLYRVLPELVQEGKIAKQGRGWHPRAA
jgi:hypothetical protein